MENATVVAWEKFENAKCKNVCQENVPDSDHFTAAPYICYGIEGVLFTLANVLVVLAIRKHPRLRARKEFILVGALAVANIVTEIGFIVASLYRVPLIQNKRATDCRSSWDCMLSVHSFLWVFGYPASYFMLFTINADRFFCVFCPVKYPKLKRSYGFILAGVTYVAGALVAVASVILSYKNAEFNCPQYPAICMLESAVGTKRIKHGYKTIFAIETAAIAASVALYFIIPFIYHLQIELLRSRGSVSDVVALMDQKKLLVTLGISSMFSFFLLVIPMGSRLAFASEYGFNQWPWSGVIRNLNSCVNLFVFLLRHKKFRKGAWAVLKCEHIEY